LLNLKCQDALDANCSGSFPVYKAFETAVKTTTGEFINDHEEA